jgi:hypothetical protein
MQIKERKSNDAKRTISKQRKKSIIYRGKPTLTSISPNKLLKFISNEKKT